VFISIRNRLLLLSDPIYLIVGCAAEIEIEAFFSLAEAGTLIATNAADNVIAAKMFLMLKNVCFIILVLAF
jgi:hypothetical protein